MGKDADVLRLAACFEGKVQLERLTEGQVIVSSGVD